MSFIYLLNSYLTLNLLLAGGFFVTKICKLRPLALLQIEYFSVLSFITLAVIQPLLPGPLFTNSTVKIWTASRMNDISSSNMISSGHTLSFAHGTPGPVPTTIPYIFIILSAAIFGWAAYRLFKEISFLRSIVKASYQMRKKGKVYLLINSTVRMPFSFWFPGKYVTVIPESMVSDSDDFRVSVLHEFQHHRQGDTRFIHLMNVLRALCIWNPFVHLLSRHISETQELACDEKLLTQKKVSIHDYTICLLRAAKNAVSIEKPPVCAAGLCFNQKRHILMRRIQMFHLEPKSSNALAKYFAVIMILLVSSLAVFASRNLVQDRRITLEEGKRLAVKAQLNSKFPIVMNEEVLAQLNRYLGTPEGREHMSSSLVRKERHEQTLTDITKKYQNPDELNAIPIAESGYENLPARFSVKAAGLWMFIPSTARRYGMKVNDVQDERLDVRKETDAAHRYLLSNKVLLNDWLLAIFAYNVGEYRVQKGIEKYGTNDVWELSRHIKGDKDYMAKVMASIIIMKNDDVLK